MAQFAGRPAFADRETYGEQLTRLRSLERRISEHYATIRLLERERETLRCRVEAERMARTRAASAKDQP